jgi:hypothetical protein
MATHKDKNKFDSDKKFAEEAKSMESILHVMDVATELRQRTEDAQVYLDVDLLKEDMKKTIMDTAKIKGEPLTEDQANTAIDYYLSQMNKFKEPQKSSSYSLVEAYVDRARIGRKYGIPALVTGVAALTIWGAVELTGVLRIKSLESKTEKSVMSAYQKKMNLESTANTFGSAKVIYVNPKEMELLMSNVRFTLQKTDEFFQDYCPDGDAKETVTKENYASVKNELNGITEIIATAEQSATKGNDLILKDQGLVSTKTDLDAIIGAIKSTKDVPAKLLSKAETDYNGGIASVSGLNLESAINYRNSLNSDKNQIEAFIVLPTQLEQAYSAIESVVREDAARMQAKSLYDDGKVQLSEVNVTALSDDVKKLQTLDAELRQVYRIQIINRDGEKSGIDRYYNGNISAFYIVVEAVDENGRIIPRSIKSVENNSVRTVKTWGERVPEAVYELVKSDKMDNGIIDNNLFSVKEKGYLNDKVVMKDDRGRVLTKSGQITEW